MKKALSILLSVIFILSMSVVGISAKTSDPISADIYVTIADQNGENVVAGEPLTVTDTDSDGKLTINDALYAAHEAFFDGGADAGYATADTQYGLSLAKLWGVANGGSYGYYLNNASAWSLSDPLKNGDYLAAFIYSDPVACVEHYTYFDRLFYRVVAGEVLTLNYSEAAYDELWNPVTLPVDRAFIILNGEKIQFTTNPDGQAFLSFSEPGLYTLSAVVEDRKLVKPVAFLEVKPAATLIGDADGNGEVEILDATLIQRRLVNLAADEEIDMANADADRSADITILDATAIQRYLAGIVNEL